MTKKQLLKIFTFSLIFILNLFFTNRIFAATLILEPSKDSVGIEEQFYVDLMLNPSGESINALEGSVSFSSDDISFIRVENGKSIVNLWVEEPRIEGHTISFAGVISNGFDGVINPFNLNQKLPGLVTRFVFEANKSGQVNFLTSSFYLNLNNGSGTETRAPIAHSSINIGNFINKVIYENKINSTPELEAYVIRDPNIFNNKYTLVFKATDKETGIKNVMIKEGKRNWEEIESPYLLKDQFRHSIITLKATNFKDVSITINIDKVPYDWKLLARVLIIIIVITLFLWVIKKIYVNKK